MRLLKIIKNHVYIFLKLRIFNFRNVYICKGSYIHPKVKIGKCTRINTISHIGECKIGAYCAIGGRLIVRSSDHYPNYLNIQDWAQRRIIKSDIQVAGKTKGNVEIGNAVWIGDSVIILPGVKIGDGAIIGAGSVVTKSVPAFSVSVGNPARVIKMRFSDEIIEIICRIKWWEWDTKTIQQRRELFELDLKNSSPAALLKVLDKYEGIQ